MAVVRWNQIRDPWTEMRRVQQEMDRLLHSFVGEERNRGASGLFPAINLTADEKAVTLRAEMPGVNLDRVDLSITGDTVSIKGERELGQTGGEVSYHRRERLGGHFNRTISLPFEVDPEKAVASYKDGLLELKVERAARSMPRQIKVRTA